jgi:hypothetical protein
VHAEGGEVLEDKDCRLRLLLSREPLHVKHSCHDEPPLLHALGQGLVPGAPPSLLPLRLWLPPSHTGLGPNAPYHIFCCVA